jgi:CRP/FNR family cyclic AMP-dependent transcriptional regulator
VGGAPAWKTKAGKVYDRSVASLAESLKQVPLFSGLSQRQLRRLSRHFKERTFRSGTTITRQGEMSGIGFFLVQEGEASVSIDGAEVTKLGPGDYFGELGLISGRARMATVSALVSIRCLEMASWDFRRFIRANPDVSLKLLQHLVDLLADAEERRRKAAHVPGV